MARRLVLIPGVGLVSIDSDAAQDNQVSVASDVNQHPAIETKINSISPVYWENGKAYCDIRDERTNAWKKVQLSESQVSAFVSGNTSQQSSSSSSNTGLTSVSLSNFTGNTSKGLASGKPQFTLPYNTYTIYGPYADNGHVYLAVWVGTQWKYIDLDFNPSSTQASASIDYWTPDTYYTDQVVIQAASIWKCRIAHTSSQSFNSSFWQVLSAPVTVSHDSLAGKNTNSLYMHVTQDDIDRWNGLQAQIDALATGTTISTSISIDNDATLNSATGLDPHTVVQAKFLIKGATATDAVVLNDASKVTASPTSLIGSPSVVQEAGAWYLIVPFSNVTYGVSYTLNIGSGCVLMNSAMINANSVKCTFSTVAAPTQPIVGPSTMDGKFGLDPASVTQIKFPVTIASGTLDLRLQDPTAYACSPQNIISGAPQVDPQGGFLLFSLQNALPDTEYTITAKPGIVSNAGYISNTASKSAHFGTILSEPLIGASPDDGNTSVSVTTPGKYVRFPLSTVSGTATFDIADSTKITVTGTATISSISIVNKVLNIYYTGGNDGDTNVFTVNPGAIKNYNSMGDLKLNTSSATCTVAYSIRAPVVNVPSINGNVDMALSTTTVDVPYTSTAACTLDASKISCTPANAITGAVLATSGSTTVIRLTFASQPNDQAVSVTMAAGVVKNLGVTPSNGISFAFQYTAVAPVVSQSATNGLSVNAATLTQVQFAVSGTNLAIANASLITMSPSAISGTPTLASGILTVPVAVSANVSYTLTINSGAVKNRNTTNTTATVCNFATATTFNVNQSSTSGTRVPVTTSSLTFALTNVNGSASIVDTTKITGVGCSITSSSISGNTLTVSISGLTYSSTASVTVAAGALRDVIMTNTNSVTCTFTTQGNVPVVNPSPSDGLTKVATSIGYVEFPVTASGTVAIASASNITCSQAGAISGVSITGSVGTYNLRVSLNALANGTTYTINVAAGAIVNDGTTNTGTATCTFKVVDSSPVVSQASANGTYVDSATFTTLTFPLTSQSACTIANQSMIVATNATASASISGSNLIVTLSGLTVNKTVTVQVKAGTIQNADSVVNANSVTCTLYTKGDVPVIIQSTTNTLQSVAISPTYIEYAVTASGTVAIANANLVSVTPNHFQSATMVSGKLRVAINFVNDTSYTVAIQPGLLVNAQTTSTQSLTTTFKTARAAPTLSQASQNGTTQPTGAITLSFPITSTGTPTLVSSSYVSVTNATLVDASVSGSSLNVTINAALYSKSVSVTVAAGAITNGDASNASGITCTYTTKGSVPVVGQSSINTTTVAKTTSTVTFPITSVSGTLTLVSSALVVCPSGYDSIISSSAISGSNLVVTLNTASMVYNKTYAIQVQAGAVANDGVASTNAVTCTFTTQAGVPTLTNSALNGTVQPLTTSTASFAITAPSMTGTFTVADVSKITATNATITSKTISGSNLVVNFSGLSNSKSVSIVVAAGAIANGGVVNTASTTCTFTTVGALVTIGQSTDNGTSTLAAGAHNVDFPLSATSFGTLSVDNLKVTTTPSAKSASASIVNVSGTNYLRVPMTLASATTYTITISAAAVTNDTTASTNSVTCTFTTVAGSTGRTVLWEYQFILPNAVSSFNLFNQSDWGSKSLTTVDIYGPNYDGAGNLAEIRWYGYNGNITQPSGYVVPRSGIDSYSSTINPDMGYSFDDTTGVVQFDTGSPSPKVYKVIKYAA